MVWRESITYAGNTAHAGELRRVTASPCGHGGRGPPAESRDSVLVAGLGHLVTLANGLLALCRVLPGKLIPFIHPIGPGAKTVEVVKLLEAKEHGAASSCPALHQGIAIR